MKVVRTTGRSSADGVAVGAGDRAPSVGPAQAARAASATSAAANRAISVRVRVGARPLERQRGVEERDAHNDPLGLVGDRLEDPPPHEPRVEVGVEESARVGDEAGEV